MYSYTHITWKYKLRNQYPLTELKSRRFSEHDYITVRGGTNFGEKRNVWPILTMWTKVRISRAFSCWNFWDSTNWFLEALQNTLITIDCFSQSLGRCMKLRTMKLKSWLLTNLTFCPPTGRGQKKQNKHMQRHVKSQEIVSTRCSQMRKCLDNYIQHLFSSFTLNMQQNHIGSAQLEHTTR